MPEATDNAHPCGNCAFFSNSIWEPADEGSVAVLAHQISRMTLAVGQVLFEQDSENLGVICISKGLMALRTHHPSGSSTLFRLAYPGQIIGFRSFLGNHVHRTEAKAVLASRVCTVSRKGANRILRSNPAVLNRLVSRCIDEIDRNRERIVAAATKSNKQRLAELLVHLMREHAEPFEGGLRMHLPLSRSDLADLIGVQPETLSRLVGRLENDGGFSITGREVRVPADFAVKIFSGNHPPFGTFGRSAETGCAPPS